MRGGWADGWGLGEEGVKGDEGDGPQGQFMPTDDETKPIGLDMPSRVTFRTRPANSHIVKRNKTIQSWLQIVKHLTFY